MSERFNMILREVSAFSEGIERYRSTTPYNDALCRDAYTRFYRLQQRFIKEKREEHLTPVKNKRSKNYLMILLLKES
jgi:hypothetical protein